MKIIPIIAAPSQRLSILLDGQNCQISIEQKGDFMYLSLSVNNSPVINSIICRDRIRLVPYAYLPFVGNLAFIDTQGTDDPNYTGLGERFKLVYLP